MLIRLSSTIFNSMLRTESRSSRFGHRLPGCWQPKFWITKNLENPLITISLRASTWSIHLEHRFNHVSCGCETVYHSKLSLQIQFRKQIKVTRIQSIRRLFLTLLEISSLMIFYPTVKQPNLTSEVFWSSSKFGAYPRNWDFISCSDQLNG